ncbi:MAG: PEGA domain-containing protein [Calditrichaeota bacterium]|nr:MAG: PEGA domain-containing protein [Calditrichota bacterium]
MREILHDLDIGPNLHANANDSSGVMKVFSEPDSCLVFLDNEMLGYTPLQLGYLEAKDYEIRLEKENYRAARGIVSVQNGHVQKIHMILRSEVRITIESDPPGAMIYVNDAPVGLSPKTIRATAELPYNFRFTHPDFNDVEKQLSFSKDKRLTVEFGTDMKKWVYIGGGSAATLGVLYYLVYRGTEADARKEGGLPAPPGRP